MTRMHESLKALKVSLEDLGQRINTVISAIDSVVENHTEQHADQPERGTQRHPDPPPPDHGHP